MATIGYARVSTTGQNLDSQLDALNKAGCEKIFEEKQSGLDGNRPVLAKALDYCREGDTFLFTRFDRLARNTRHLLDIVEQLQAKGVIVKATEQSLDTSAPEGKLMLTMLAGFAQFETELRRERQMEGIAKAKERGAYANVGRKAAVTPAMRETLLTERGEGTSIRKLAARHGLSVSVVARAVKAAS